MPASATSVYMILATIDPWPPHIHATISNLNRHMLPQLSAPMIASVSAINWGSVGLFGFDCVAFLFGGQIGMLSRVIYTLVGLAGIWCITMLFREKEPMESGGQV